MFKKESLLLMGQITLAILVSSVIIMVGVKPLINRAKTVMPQPVASNTTISK